MSDTTEATITFAEYVYGDETTRLRFERQEGGELHEHRRIYDEWAPVDARETRATARYLLAGDEWHRRGACRRGTVEERMSCGTCALLGYEPRGGWDDDYKVRRDGPNYAGWARVYVEAGRPIPREWAQAFAAEGDDNPAYFDALGRSLVTFGHPGYES